MSSDSYLTKELNNNSIESITKRSEEISSAMEVIVDIASQTNMLAINAAIEAANSGQNGYGFKVIADEIRRLAVFSKESASRVANLIHEVQHDADMVLEMRKTIRKQNSTFKQVIDMVNQKIEVKDADGRYIMLNEMASKVFNRPIEEIIGKSVFDFYEKKEAQGYFDSEKELLRKKKKGYSFEKVTLDNTPKYYFSEKNPIHIPETDEWNLIIVQKEIEKHQAEDPQFLSDLVRNYEDIRIAID